MGQGRDGFRNALSEAQIVFNIKGNKTSKKEFASYPEFLNGLLNKARKSIEATSTFSIRRPLKHSEILAESNKRLGLVDSIKNADHPEVNDTNVNSIEITFVRQRF